MGGTTRYFMGGYFIGGITRLFHGKDNPLFHSRDNPFISWEGISWEGISWEGQPVIS